MITDQEFDAILADGLRLWNQHKFFECHDKLEEAWKAVKHEKKREPAADPRRDFVHGLILLAVAYHHWRNQNLVGARRKFDEALERLRSYPARFGGLDLARLRAKAHEHRRRLDESSATFVPADIPVLEPVH